MVSASAENSVTACLFYIGINKSGVLQEYGVLQSVSTVNLISVASGIIKCVAGDTIQVISGPATSITGTTAHMSVAWIAPA
jgi:hypothetical protein